MRLLSKTFGILSKQVDKLRLVLIPSEIIKSQLYLYVLYWLDNSDLEDIDRKIETNSYDDNDFKNAIATRFGKLRCSNCGWEGYTLVMSLADVYIGHSQLEDKKRKLLTDDKIKKCPNCTSRLRQLVVNIFPQ